MAGSAKPIGTQVPSTLGRQQTPAEVAAQAAAYQDLVPMSGPSVGGWGGGETASIAQGAFRGGPQPAAAPAFMQPSGSFNVNQAAAQGLQGAMQGTAAGMNFQPMQASAAGYRASTMAGAAPIRAQNVQAGQIAGTNLGAYTNPYESQVVGQALGDIERQRQMQQNLTGAQASAARAFGGSRHGIAEAETNRAFAEQAAQTAAGLRQQGYQTAQQLAGQDIASRMQAALANQQAGLTAQQSTAANTLAAQQANQAALNQAGQFGASAQNAASLANQQAQLMANQQRLGAASQLGALGQQAFNTGQAITQQQMQQGLMQQMLQQQLIDAARAQYAGFTGAPNAALSAPLAALGVAPVPESTTSSYRPGLFDYLGMGLGVMGAMSDVRLKENIKPAGTLGGVKFYTWDWNEDGKRVADPKQPTFGVIADELKKTHPQHVTRGNDGYLRVNYAGLAAELQGAA